MPLAPTGVCQNETALPNFQHHPVVLLKPYDRNARTHSQKQIKQIARSIERFGFNNPILISDSNEIIAGHGRVEAAKLLGLKEVPCLQLSHLSPDERRAYVLADNKLAENAGWDNEILAIELQGLIDLEFDVDLTGFALAEIDLILEEAVPKPERIDEVPALPDGPVVSCSGDLWQLGDHRLLCGDARSSADVSRLVGEGPIDLIFTDPPYNVAIDGHVSGLGKQQHREFAFASGEMTTEEFTDFLTDTLSNAAAVAVDGAIAFVCMDWRHMQEMLTAGQAAFTELKNLCVWNKTNAGMGTFYRSKHELVFVYKIGTAPHTNSFGLGDTGRYRTNVWDYAGANVVGADRDGDLAMHPNGDLAMHPTVKPVAMVRDAIQDCSKRGGAVLDVFGGSGTTLIAAELCGRKARILEYDPAYCDTIIRRFEAQSGGRALHVETGRSFSELEQAAHDKELS